MNPSRFVADGSGGEAGNVGTGSFFRLHSETNPGSPHSHALSGSVGLTTGSNGDGPVQTTPSNPPYLVVNYIIKT